jgi:hypothetical protein
MVQRRLRVPKAIDVVFIMSSLRNLGCVFLIFDDRRWSIRLVYLRGPEMRELPWRVGGESVKVSHSASEVLRAVGLDWKVMKTDSFEGKASAPGRSFVVREDLWKEGTGGLLGTVRSSYEPMQNAEAFGLFDPIIESGIAAYDSAGAVNYGEWLWMVLRFSGDLDVGPNDPVGKFLLFGHTPANGYYHLAYLPVRLAGGNTVSGGRFHNPPPYVTEPTDRPRRFKVPVEEAVVEMQRQFVRRVDTFRAMTQFTLNDEGLSQYLERVFVEWSERDKSASPNKDQLDLDKRECIRLFKEGEGNQLSPSAGTLWAACSAVTEYVDFVKVGCDLPRSVRDVWFDELKGAAVQVATQLAERNEATGSSE